MKTAGGCRAGSSGEAAGVPCGENNENMKEAIEEEMAVI